MDWRREGDMLEAILSLLVALAGLADRAASLPLCLQLPVLAFLARGEDVARSFVIGLPSGTVALVAVSQVPDRAERLADELRALARVLRTLIDRARQRARLSPDPELPSASPREPVRPRECLVPAQPAPDTS